MGQRTSSNKIDSLIEVGFWRSKPMYIFRPDSSVAIAEIESSSASSSPYYGREQSSNTREYSQCEFLASMDCSPKSVLALWVVVVAELLSISGCQRCLMQSRIIFFPLKIVYVLNSRLLFFSCCGVSTQGSTYTQALTALDTRHLIFVYCCCGYGCHIFGSQPLSSH